MGVSYGLGIDVGTSTTAASVYRSNGHGPELAAVQLGSDLGTVPSALFLGGDGRLRGGEGADRLALTDTDRVVRDFKRRVGEEAPLRVGDQLHPAHDLVAAMARWVVDEVTERENGAPERIVLTHPAHWSPDTTSLLIDALARVGLADVTLLTEPAAVAISHTFRSRTEAAATLAVCDLGGGTVDAAVVRSSGGYSFELLGQPESTIAYGGIELDEAVYSRILRTLGTSLDGLAPSEGNVPAALARLRRACAEAKEALSVDTGTEISVQLPGLLTRVHLTRADFEDLVRETLGDVPQILRAAMASAGLRRDDLDAVLLVGGCSRIPIVAQLVAAELGQPTVIDSEAKTAVAAGAALSTATALAAGASVVAGSALPAAGGSTTPAVADTGLPVAPAVSDVSLVAELRNGAGIRGPAIAAAKNWDTAAQRSRMRRGRTLVCASALTLAVTCGAAALLAPPTGSSGFLPIGLPPAMRALPPLPAFAGGDLDSTVPSFLNGSLGSILTGPSAAGFSAASAAIPLGPAVRVARKLTTMVAPAAVSAAPGTSLSTAAPQAGAATIAAARSSEGTAGGSRTPTQPHGRRHRGPLPSRRRRPPLETPRRLPRRVRHRHRASSRRSSHRHPRSSRHHRHPRSSRHHHHPRSSRHHHHRVHATPISPHPRRGRPCPRASRSCRCRRPSVLHLKFVTK